ncbi:uncharacterized protein KD926_009170 [Aspergillus affinis]|uniref:uncharacterized protein n=1 Tax=Aspergillus affinis TaxID=1070780 RepID=UPI0022FEFED3|nr:uncharacterized protein KD926_009170 [Aspergillus affinis]KAI9039700.1 hypothetical protein KD926_009170 [Aspergillus affinis]
MAQPMSKATLLTIPVELRYAIYEMIFYPTVGHQPLLHVCRQIREEALTILLHFVRAFDSLPKLASWASRGPPHLRHLIRIVDVNCLESSLTPFREWHRHLIPGTQVAPGSWEATYLSRVGKLDSLTSGKASVMQKLKHAVSRGTGEPVRRFAETLTALPGIRKMSLTLSGNYDVDDKDPLIVEQGLVLEMVVRLLPGLRQLEFQAGPVDLEFLSHAANLRRLEFTGYAATGPDETLRILLGLPKLEALVLRRPPSSNDLDNGMESKGLTRRVAVTPEVVEKLNPLKEVHLVHFAGELKSEFVTGAMLRAIAAHASTLEVLHVDHDGVMADDAATELKALLPQLVSLKKLALDFVLSEQLGGNFDIRDVIPSNVRILNLRIV